MTWPFWHHQTLLIAATALPPGDRLACKQHRFRYADGTSRSLPGELQTQIQLSPKSVDTCRSSKIGIADVTGLAKSVMCHGSISTGQAQGASSLSANNFVTHCI